MKFIVNVKKTSKKKTTQAVAVFFLAAFVLFAVIFSLCTTNAKSMHDKLIQFRDYLCMQRHGKWKQQNYIQSALNEMFRVKSFQFDERHNKKIYKEYTAHNNNNGSTILSGCIKF